MKISKIVVRVLLLTALINLNNIISLFPFDPAFIVFLLSAILFFLVGLLGLIIWALAVDMKVFQQLYSKPYSIIKYNDINVNYLWRLNGGGIVLAYEFVHVVSQKIGKVGHVYEYCSGPGFIGFNLLANGLCDQLTLSDVNPEAVKAIRETIKMNNLQDKVRVYQSDCLDSILEGERWDLVVGNPPWDLRTKSNKDIKVHDSGAIVHRKFFQDVQKFMKPNGSILFAEGAEYTDTDQFKKMIELNGLKIIESFMSVPFFKILKGVREYAGLKAPLIIFLRFCLCFRGVYFIWSKKV